MVGGFFWSHSSLDAERSHPGGNESAEIISGALGMSQAGWKHPTDTMPDSIIESVQEIVGEMNKAKRGLYFIPVCIDDREH
jgi:hypothetical protein